MLVSSSAHRANTLRKAHERDRCAENGSAGVMACRSDENMRAEDVKTMCLSHTPRAFSGAKEA